ncbi:MAG TPA: Bax inhibitor-1/YccA family protein [Candidatus Nanoarchaeia archaeon]|nr:Bax inhibitor-1/YccA family protein [Candidatus Nanoarchaeia archaeon]
MRTANPALNEKTFFNFSFGNTVGYMTLNGTVNKSLVLLLLVIISSALSWNLTLSYPTVAYGVLIGAAIAGLILAIITIFKHAWAPVTAPLYALVEGVVLGVISSVFEQMFSGIVFQAVLLTFGTLAVLLFVYKSGWIRATENFKLGVVAATGAVFLIYLITFILNLFGKTIPYIHDNGWIGIGFSLVVVVIAALNLVLDFDFIEKGAEQQAPKYMEWYAAFGLMVTLIWLYLEILRLLAKVRSRD